MCHRWQYPAMKKNILIAPQELKLYVALKDFNDWISTVDVAKAAKIPIRTAKFHLSRFKTEGLVDEAPVWPKRYKLNPKANKRYLAKLEEAKSVMRKA